MVDVARELNGRSVRVLRFDAAVRRIGGDGHRRAQAVNVTGEADRGVVAVVTGDIDG